jgi:AcrR family transcriptional regulator
VAEQRSRLLHAAAEVFAKGFKNASVAAIVKTAGMSRRTFYEHFHDLTDALVQLYDGAAYVLLQAVESAQPSRSTAEDRLVAALSAYVHAIAQNADLARIMYGEIRAAGPDHALRHQATLDRFAAVIRAWAAQARAARLISRVPDDFTIYATLSAIEGVAMRYVYLGQESELGKMVPRFVEFVLTALR